MGLLLSCELHPLSEVPLVVCVCVCAHTLSRASAHEFLGNGF